MAPRTRLGLAALGLALLAGPAAGVAAQDAPSDEDVQLYARVIVDTTVLRSGPSQAFRRVHVAHRGDVFPIEERANRGYWFRVALPDGTSGWIQGDAVYNHEVGDEEASGGRFLPWLLAPPPLPVSSGEISVSAGYMNGGGIFAVRPSFLVAPAFGIELTLAAQVSRGGRILIGGLGGIVNVLPDSPIIPFVVVGGGQIVSDPNADSFLLQSGSRLMAYGGGGLRIGFKYRFTVRMEVRSYVFYDANRYVAQEEYSGGVTVFF